MTIRLLALLSLLVLAGCQSTVFQQAPLADAGCDDGLVGHWASVEDPGEEAEVRLDVSTDCQLHVTDRHEGAMRTGEGTHLHIGHIDAANYLWIDAAWARRRFESELDSPDGDIVLMRYAFDDAQLVVTSPDDKTIAHRIIDEDIDGETSKTADGLLNRITDRGASKLLATEGFFGDNDMRFRREGAVASP